MRKIIALTAVTLLTCAFNLCANDAVEESWAAALKTVVTAHTSDFESLRKNTKVVHIYTDLGGRTYTSTLMPDQASFEKNIADKKIKYYSYKTGKKIAETEEYYSSAGRHLRTVYKDEVVNMESTVLGLFLMDLNVRHYYDEVIEAKLLKLMEINKAQGVNSIAVINKLAADLKKLDLSGEHKFVKQKLQLNECAVRFIKANLMGAKKYTWKDIGCNSTHVYVPAPASIDNDTDRWLEQERLKAAAEKEAKLKAEAKIKQQKIDAMIKNLGV